MPAGARARRGRVGPDHVLEISPDGARGAVRFVGGIQAAAAGVQTTLDDYPEGDEWVGAVMGRVSL